MRLEINQHPILILSGVQGDTRRYRTFHPYEQLQLAGVDCQLSHVTDPDLPAKAADASLVILHRVAHDRFVERLIRSIQDRSGACICDVDDLVFDTAAFPWIDAPDFPDPWRASLYQEDMRRNSLTLDKCQAVIASTGYLSERVRRLGKPVWVHRNSFSLEMLALSQAAAQTRPPSGDRVIIGYASGTPTHDRDFEVAKPALQSILRSYPQTELWIVGRLNPGKDWGALESRIRLHKFVPWRRLPNLLARFDINLAPLRMDNPFAQSKSEIKYMEAALVRVPTVASPTDAFRYAIRPGENGFLVASQAEWTEALAKLVEHAELRRAIGEEAHLDALRRYHPTVRSAELLTTLEQIAAQHGVPLPLQPEAASRRAVSSGKVLPAIGLEAEHSPTLARRALYSLRHRGVRTLLIQIWIYFRRLLAPVFPFRKIAQ